MINIEDPLKIAVCEDTAADRDTLLKMIEKSEIPASCTCFTSGEELLENFVPQTYDLLLTDIYMGRMTGIDAVAEIRKQDEDIPVAFVTTSIDHTLESYRLSALKYIEKPYKQKDIEDILSLARMKKLSGPSVSIMKNGKFERLLIAKILYFEQQNHQVDIYLKNGSCDQFYGKLSDVLSQLEGENFYSPHKSFSVNLNYVRYLDTDLKCFVMDNGKTVPIRRESMSEAKKAMESFLFERTRRIKG